MSRKPELLPLRKNGWMPNNERFPVLLYRAVLAGNTGNDPTAAMESLFDSNGWPSQWRNGVYDFHHYHSTAHEALGFVRGWARLLLGGENGTAIVVNPGDVAILPAGTGHCRIDSGDAFLVVGAYPRGQDWDLCRTEATAEVLNRIRNVPVPATDALGTSLRTLWL